MTDLRETIMNKALETAREIETKQNELFGLQATRKDFAEILASDEARHLVAVSSELNDAQKPKFSNAEARAAEVNSRLASDKDANKCKATLALEDEKIAIARYCIEAMNQEVSIYKAFLHGS